MYDWANSGPQCTIVTAVFPLFFSSVAAATLNPTVATERFAWVTTIGVAIAAFLGPTLGVLADYRALKKPLLAVCVAVGALSAASMVFIDHGEWKLASVLFLITNVALATSFVFYDSLLPHIAAPNEMDRVSTSGYALGYVGGGLLLVANLAWILKPEIWGLSGTTAAIKLSFLSVAVWWVVFAIPLFRRVPEPPAASRSTLVGAQFSLLRQTWATFRDLRQHRQAYLLLIAFLLYNDGIQTMIKMAAVYGAEIGIGMNAQIVAFIVVQFVGIPCAFLFGALADRIGAKPSLYIALTVYVGIAVIGYSMTETWEFFLLAVMVGTVQGGAQGLSRSLFARMIPADRSTEYFGFFSVFEKIAGILGPLMFGTAVALTGSSRPAVLVLVVFFVVGGAVLSRVDVAAGEREVRSPA
jgi:UMF1 family MFS transporter